jgi:hypothetical protein
MLYVLHRRIKTFILCIENKNLSLLWICAILLPSGLSILKRTIVEIYKKNPVWGFPRPHFFFPPKNKVKLFQQDLPNMSLDTNIYISRVTSCQSLACWYMNQR